MRAEFRTTFGHSRPLPPPPPRWVLLTADEVHTLCLALGADADRAEQAGDYERADRLVRRVASLRAAEAKS